MNIYMRTLMGIKQGHPSYEESNSNQTGTSILLTILTVDMNIYMRILM